MKHKYILRRMLCAVMAICLVMSLFLCHVPTASATNASDLQQQADELEAEAKTLKGKLNQIKKEKKAKLAEKQLLEEEIATIASQIRLSEEMIVLKEEELTAAQEKEAEHYDLFCQRFRDMEESRTISYLAILLRSASFSDLLDRLVFVKEVAAYDNKIMADLKTARQVVAEAKASLEATQSELEVQKTTLEEEEAAIDAVIKELEDQEEEYKDDISDLQADLDRLEEQLAEYNPPAIGGTTGSGTLIWPCASRRITSYFGNRDRPTAGASKNHKGIDIGASKGTSIYAADGGTVTISTYSKSAGNYIKIDHGNGMATVYMHCNTRNVKVGDTVAKGQVIATVGSTGVSTGPHLHFGVIVNGGYVNPLNYVSP